MTSPAVLLAALRPFAKLADEIDSLRKANPYLDSPSYWSKSCEWSDLERARSAIATFEAGQKEAELMTLVSKSVAWFDSLSPNEQDAHRKVQAESWARAMLPCKHGVGDWETCSQCREEAAQPTTPSSEPDDFASATQIANAVLAAHYRDPALSTLAREYLRLAKNVKLELDTQLKPEEAGTSTESGHPPGQLASPPAEDAMFAFLCRKYVQRADSRQQEMGLQYTEAETHDLARELSRFISRPSTSPVPFAEDEALIASARRVAHAISEKPEQTVCWKLADRLEALSRQPDRDAVIEDETLIATRAIMIADHCGYRNAIIEECALRLEKRDMALAAGIVRFLKSRPATQPQERKK